MDIAFLRSLDMAASKLVQDPDLLPEDADTCENDIAMDGRSLESTEVVTYGGLTEEELDQ